MSVHGNVPGGWYIYRFWPKAYVRCAVAGCHRRHPMYIGISNEPWRREKQHQEDKPWHPHTRGWEVDDSVLYPTKRAAELAEAAAIRAELPLANDQHNRDNAHRVDFRYLVAQPDGGLVYRQPRREWAPWQKRAAWLGGGWVGLAVLCWIVAASVNTVTLSGGAVSGAVGATVIYGMVFGSRRPRRRRRPARRSRRRRR